MRILSVILMLMCYPLIAQIQVLPDLEVSGESQVKIFLYKKALPYSFESTRADSLFHYLPETMPLVVAPSLQSDQPNKRHSLQLEAGSRFWADASYRYYPQHPQINAFGIGASFKAPKSDFLFRHINVDADLQLPGTWTLGSSIHHSVNESFIQNNQYTDGEFLLNSTDIDLSILKLGDMSNKFVLYNFEQDRKDRTRRNHGLSWTHHSQMEIKDFQMQNALYFYDNNQAAHLSINLANGSFDKSSLHLIYDGFNLMPSLGFQYTLEAGYDKIFSVSNKPLSMENGFLDLILDNHWINIEQTLRNTSLPLNLMLRYQSINPFEADFDLACLSIQNQSRFYKYMPMLRDDIALDIPTLRFGDVFENTSTLQASFGEAPFCLTQSIIMSLAYLSNQNWRPQAYNSLLSFATQASYQHSPYQLSISLDQGYFSRDEHRNKLDDVIDLSLKASYDLGKLSEVYLGAQNLLSSDIRSHNKLPRDSAALYLGMIHRF
ncbi:MAG: hypothetical protein PHR59_00515 [Candidatus Cloacimonetes bacterium]|nr:hypothetical protein [Candidatus Cloacimonadota bacterium]